MKVEGVHKGKQRHKDELLIEDVQEEDENSSSMMNLKKVDGDGTSSYKMPASSAASSVKNSCLSSGQSESEDEDEDESSISEDDEDDDSEYSLADSYDTEVANVHEFENNL